MITQLVTKVICYSITFVVLTFVIKNIHMIRKNKLKKIKPKQIEAEWLIYNMKKKQIRPIRTEKAYNTTKYNFNKALKNKLTAKPKEVYSEKTIVNNVDNSYTILFEQGKSTVKDITPVINALKQNNKNITIIGNISPEGSEKVNKALALARAKSVRNALIKAGISADRITITNEYADQRRATIIVH